MKVLVVSSKYPPEYSGSGLRAHRTHIRLREKFNIESEVICSSVEYRSSESYSIDGVQVQRVVSKPLRSIHAMVGKGPIRRLTNAAVFRSEIDSVDQILRTKTPDVVHVFGYSPATLAAIRWANMQGIPLMRELVNRIPSPFQYPPGRNNDPDYLFPENSIVVAISKYLGRISREASVKNVWVRPNPVDVERFHFTDSHERNNARKLHTAFSKSDRVMVYVSKFNQRKNHTFLISVLSKLPERYKLLLAGPPIEPGDPSPGLSKAQALDLWAMAAGMGLGHRLLIQPSFVDAAEYMRVGDVFCMPSENEAMGTPLLEALSTGLPVVANAGESSFKEWIVNGQNGFLCDLDSPSWAEAVIKTERFTTADRKTISDRIKFEISTDQIDAEYHRLLCDLANGRV